MSLLSAINTSLSGLRTVTSELQMVANNISNASTAGYTRKSAEISTSVNGVGVTIASYTRATDTVLAATLNDAISESSMLGTQESYLDQVQTILGTDSSDNPPLSSAISKFSSAWTQLAAQPESAVQQQAVLSAATNLVTQVQAAAADVEDLDRLVQDDTNASLSDLNSLLQQIRALNGKIAKATTAEQPTGDLEDSRDLLIQQVAAYTNVTVMTRELGQVALYTPGGYQLIDGDSVQSFSYDGTNVTSAGNSAQSLNSVLLGGKIQALVDFRALSSPVSTDPTANVIQKLRAQLDAIADAFTDVTANSFAAAYNGAAYVAIGNNISFTSTYSGTFGNGASVAFSAGTTAGTTKVTISVDGQSDEVFDNIAGSGNALWQNIATAVNADSRLVTASAGSGTTAPSMTTYRLSGGTGEAFNGTAFAIVPYDGVAETTIATDCLTLRAQTPGTAGNDISLLIENGSGADLYTVTITQGETVETYTDVDNSLGAFWANLEAAINAGSSLVTATADGGVTDPSTLLGTPFALAGGGDDGTNSLTLSALEAGTASNGIRMTLADGTLAGTFKATITSASGTTEIYDNVSGTGNAFWVNLADAINTGPSGLVMATAGDSTHEPIAGTTTTYTLSGGDDYLQANFFTGTDRTNFSVNSALIAGTITMKTSGAEAIVASFSDSTKTFTAAGLRVTSGSYTTLATSILTGFQQAANNVTSLSKTASEQQSYLEESLANETGVNTDEELVNLTALQNAYAASAHVLQTIQNMFDILRDIL